MKKTLFLVFLVIIMSTCCLFGCESNDDLELGSDESPFAPTVYPEFEKTINDINLHKLPTEQDELIKLAVQLYTKANENYKKLNKCMIMVDCDTQMTINIGAKIKMPVKGYRYILKNGNEFWYSEYSIPKGDKFLSLVAGKVSPENTQFATRSYTDISKMDYVYSEKSYKPKFNKNAETGETEIVCDWSEGNMVDKSKHPIEQAVPVFNASQSGTYYQTAQVINENTIKNASIVAKRNEDNKVYYELTLELDIENEETTSISLKDLRNGAGDDAHYTSMVETVEIWENGYYKRFRSVDGWEAGIMSSVLTFDTYFYYDDDNTNPSNYLNYNEVKQKALAYNEKKK